MPRLQPRRILALLAFLSASWSTVAARADDDKRVDGSSSLVAPSGDGSHDATRSQGIGFHTHFDIGLAYGQQSVRVEVLNAETALAGGAEDEAVASGLGMSGRLELWPLYSRYGGIGAFGAGHVGGLKRAGATTGLGGGSTGLTAAVGIPRLKLLGTVGRSWQAAAYGRGVSLQTDVADLDANDELTTGAEKLPTYNAGIGLRTSFDSQERRGLDLWLMFDEPTRNRAGRPAVAMPRASESALSVRGVLWLRDTLQVSAQVTMRPATVNDGPEGTRLTERGALITVGWSLDRFSRSYGG